MESMFVSCVLPFTACVFVQSHNVMLGGLFVLGLAFVLCTVWILLLMLIGSCFLYIYRLWDGFLFMLYELFITLNKVCFVNKVLSSHEFQLNQQTDYKCFVLLIYFLWNCRQKFSLNSHNRCCLSLPDCRVRYFV